MNKVENRRVYARMLTKFCVGLALITIACCILGACKKNDKQPSPNNVPTDPNAQQPVYTYSSHVIFKGEELCDSKLAVLEKGTIEIFYTNSDLKANKALLKRSGSGMGVDVYLPVRDTLNANSSPYTARYINTMTLGSCKGYTDTIIQTFVVNKGYSTNVKFRITK